MRCFMPTSFEVRRGLLIPVHHLHLFGWPHPDVARFVPCFAITRCTTSPTAPVKTRQPQACDTICLAGEHYVQRAWKLLSIPWAYAWYGSCPHTLLQVSWRGRGTLKWLLGQLDPAASWRREVLLCLLSGPRLLPPSAASLLPDGMSMSSLEAATVLLLCTTYHHLQHKWQSAAAQHALAAPAPRLARIGPLMGSSRTETTSTPHPDTLLPKAPTPTTIHHFPQYQLGGPLMWEEASLGSLKEAC